ncbi:hypothetical protein ACE1SV_57940 [Streptomyces sennicomposti]
MGFEVGPRPVGDLLGQAFPVLWTADEVLADAGESGQSQEATAGPAADVGGVPAIGGESGACATDRLMEGGCHRAVARVSDSVLPC